MKALLAWLQSALATVYKQDGLVGVATVVLLVVVVVALLAWLRVDVLGLLG